MLRGRRTTYLQPSIRVLLCSSPIPGEGTPHRPAGARVAAGACLARRGSRSATAVLGESEHAIANQVGMYACEEIGLVGCEDKDRLGSVSLLYGRADSTSCTSWNVRYVTLCLRPLFWQIGGSPERTDGVMNVSRELSCVCAWTVTCDAIEASL